MRCLALFICPIAEHFIKTVWLAHVAAILALFIIVYIILRMTPLRAPTPGGQADAALRDRPRARLRPGPEGGAVIVGIFFLMMTAATPGSRMPAWITKARSYPVASLAGHALRQLAPRGFAQAKEAAPALEHALVDPTPASGDDDQPPPQTKRPTHGYSEDQQAWTIWWRNRGDLRSQRLTSRHARSR